MTAKSCLAVWTPVHARIGPYTAKASFKTQDSQAETNSYSRCSAAYLPSYPGKSIICSLLKWILNTSLGVCGIPILLWPKKDLQRKHHQSPAQKLTPPYFDTVSRAGGKQRYMAIPLWAEKLRKRNESILSNFWSACDILFLPWLQCEVGTNKEDVSRKSKGLLWRVVNNFFW